MKWNLFNERPVKGDIKEIDYNGAGQYFNNSDNKPEWLNRKPIRMAEFWIQDKLDLNDIQCFVVKSSEVKQFVESKLKGIAYTGIPVYCKPNIYF